MTEKRSSAQNKRDKEKQKALAKLAEMPVLGMAHYKMGNLATLKLQIVKRTKYSVTMRTINGKGTITVSTTNKTPIEHFIPIDEMPCSTVPTVTTETKGTIEIPQGTVCPL